AQLSHGFYGRRREYRQVRDGILQRNQRAVIIHGIGGIGKTSLIAHAADRLYHRRPRFKGVYAFDCAGSTLAPERVLLELHRYFALQGAGALERFIGQPLEPEVLAQIVAQVLVQWPLLLIFDNFETQLARTEAGFRIADEALRRFLAALVKATATNTKFVFTCRLLFELDERLGDVASLPLGDLSRPEAINLMLRLPNLARSNFWDQAKAYECFGGHPFAITQLDKYCHDHSLYDALQRAEALHTKLREHLALELNYGRLTEPARELLNRLAAFRVAAPIEAAEWVMKKQTPSSYSALSLYAKLRSVFGGSKNLQEEANSLLRSVRELIEWGLLTPVYESDELSRLDVHSLVRDFCREKQAGAWRDRLREAAGFYTNQTRPIPDDQKTPAMVWSEMESFELLMEAEDYRDAGALLNNAVELLDRWGFGRYVEGQYARVLDQVERADTAVLMHNFGVLQQGRGNYEAALDYYQRSLKIEEENGDVAGVASSLHQLGRVQQERGDYEATLDYYQRSLKIAKEIGDMAGVASSQGQIGKLLTETGHYAEAFELLLNARGTFIKLESPNAGIVVNMLKALRGKWDGFDAAWCEATGEDVPEWLQ
ncbi:MAG: tetratricopeptide repeat protein, partial [Acidobacteriota bacterium]|nr:tetratricopeptide repeat protein [Acidobacteriota bacterium]